MRTLILAAIAVAVLSACARAPRQAAAPAAMMPVISGTKAVGAPVGISPIDRMAVSRYFSQPDRARKLEMLSGEQRQSLRLGQPIPKSIDTRRVPGDLEAQLVPLPKGYRRVLAGNTLVIVDPARNVVAAKPFFAGFNP